MTPCVHALAESVTRAGALLTALGLFGWAFATALWQLYLAGPISGAGWALTSGAVLNAMVSPWFARRRPAALGMAFNGASMGGVIFSPLWVTLIAGLGFYAAAGLVAVVVVGVAWLLSGRYLGRTPASMGLFPDDDATSVHTARPSRRPTAKSSCCAPSSICSPMAWSRSTAASSRRLMRETRHTANP